MSNVYSVGNNRQLIIYAAGSNIFLRIAHFGGLERPIVLAADYNHGLNECVYNDTLYYTYISTDNSLHIKNIMESQSIYTISGNNIPELYNPSICVCNHSLLLFYLKNNPLLKHLCLHCLSFSDIHNSTEAFPVPLPSCVTDISDYHIFRADNTLFLYVNNRMFFIEEIGHIVKSYNPDIVFHVDAIQAYGKYKIVPKKYNIDLLSVSGHKIHGPKGSGFLYIKDKTRIKPIIYGGGQQKGMRSGTENVPAIAGLSAAVKLIYNDQFEDKMNNMYELKDYFIDELEKLADVVINSYKGTKSAPQIVSVSFRGVRAEVLLHALEDKNIYVSSGSACSSNKPGLSNTLVAIGLDNDLLDSTLRFSFCYNTTKEELDYAVSALKELLPVLRKYTRH